MKRSTKNILIFTGIAVTGAALAGAAYSFTMKKLMSVALDRKEPKITGRNHMRFMASTDLSEEIKKINEAGCKLKNSDCERIEISSHDGIKLIGHLKTTASPKRIIIAMHGWRSAWSQDFGIISDFWAENGCNVLYAEQRGQGESGGDFMTFGLLERYDCLDWIRWVNEKFEEGLPIYLAGISMGASTVLMTSGFELPKNVKGIIADCGFTSPSAIWKHVVENKLHIPYGLYSARAEQLCKQKINLSSEIYSCTQALKSCKIPILFIHGTDDKFVPVTMTYENYKVCASPKRLFVVPGAEHGMSYLTDKEGYERAVLQFWEETKEASDSQP